MNWINILTFCIECALLLSYTPRLSDGVICYETVGPNLTTCEISPEQNQSCYTECELLSSRFHCISRCVSKLSDFILVCSHQATTATFVSLCCTTSLCNTFNGTVTTTPTTTSNDDNSDVGNTTHIIIAVCLGVAFILIVMSLVIAVIICHWRRWSRNQLRWKNIIN